MKEICDHSYSVDSEVKERSTGTFLALRMKCRYCGKKFRFLNMEPKRLSGARTNKDRTMVELRIEAIEEASHTDNPSPTVHSSSLLSYLFRHLPKRKTT